MAGSGLKPGDIIPEALSWENFKLEMYNREVIRFESFELNYESKIEFNKGKSGESVSYSVTAYDRDAKAELHLDEMKELFLLAAAYGGDLLKLPAATLTATAETDDFVLEMVVPAVKIMKFPLKFKQGDPKVMVPLDLAVTSYPIIRVS